MLRFEAGVGDTSQKAVIMVVELRFEKTLDAWVEASRGLVVTRGSLLVGPADGVPC